MCLFLSTLSDLGYVEPTSEVQLGGLALRHQYDLSRGAVPATNKQSQNATLSLTLRLDSLSACRLSPISLRRMVVDVASLGLFILDTFEWRTVTADGTATTTKRDEGIVGGGGTYAIMGSRTWLPPNRVGILVDRGYDWPKDLDEELAAYGSEMWVFREQPDHPTTRALNLYTGEHRGMLPSLGFYRSN